VSQNDDPEARYIVVVNQRNEHALWRHPLPIPAGWTPVLTEPRPEAECVAWVDEHWRDLDADRLAAAARTTREPAGSAAHANAAPGMR
jgi:MbtH protein